MKVFLTGGTGYIGQPLAQCLVSRGWDVVALVRKPNSPQAVALTKVGVQLVPGDITDPESMRGGMSGADIVIHNAGWYELGVHPSARELMHRINVTGTETVLSVAQKLNIPRVVYVSSTIYYGDTGSEIRDESYRRQTPYSYYYEQTKVEAHEVALRYLAGGLPVILVCPAHVMGPNDHAVWGYFLRLYMNRMMPPFAWAPHAKNSGVHVNDVAEGIALAAEKGRIGETYILAGDTATLRDVVETWMTQPGGFPVRFYVPTWLAALLFAPMEPLQRMIGLPAFISRELAVGTISLAFSSAKAQRELGWTYRPFKQMWSEIMEQERQLLASRQKRNLVSRLNPIDQL